ncbi:MAG: prolyl-tRNA synthetase, family [Planctomycetota bacterium]|nr:prolyl-tRNA synthetase, family [Planctomycetota bacterium]
MRWSNALIPTQKESPTDAVAPSHILLLRAGMIRQLGAGAYSYLPLGMRVLHKAAKIVRDEMDAAGALELLMPALQPVEIWQESGRHGHMGGILMEFTLGADRHVVLGPTHEEAVTDIVRDLIKSYRQLPVTLYQIQTKFRNEPRPRFGILRTREFVMKDAYSFGANLEQLNAAYDTMYEAYCRIFDRCGFPYVAVEAESGPIGGDSSHEFMVPCATGEDVVVQCVESGYAANRERAEIGKIAWPAPSVADAPPFVAVPTPGRKTIQEVCKFLKTPENQTAKLLVFLADGQPVAALIRGDHEANEGKIRRAFKATVLEPADQAAVEKATGAPMGFLGPVGIKIPMVIDQSVAAMPAVVVGGNAMDVHLTGVVPGRDFPLDHVGDFRNAVEGDPCPRSGLAMTVGQGIEIGHVFKLGTKYSDAMGATFLDDKGLSHSLIMGCYGIGVNRILAAAVEASHDENGIIWPLNLAPYDVIVVPLQLQNEAVMQLADGLAKDFEAAGLDVLIDDREGRPGVKFKDADLIGIPLRIVIGERGLKEGTVEVKWRTDSAAHNVAAATAGETILAEVVAAREALATKAAERRAARAAARSGEQ